jgi:hypothetical protein
MATTKTHWAADLTEAFDRAAEQNKIVLIDFFNPQ